MLALGTQGKATVAVWFRKKERKEKKEEEGACDLML